MVRPLACLSRQEVDRELRLHRAKHGTLGDDGRPLHFLLRLVLLEQDGLGLVAVGEGRGKRADGVLVEVSTRDDPHLAALEPGIVGVDRGDQAGQVEACLELAEQAGQVALRRDRALDRDALGEVDVQPLLVDPGIVGLLVGEDAGGRCALRRERLDDVAGLVPAIRRFPLRIQRTFEEGVGDHVAHAGKGGIAPLRQRARLLLGHEQIAGNGDDALFFELFDRVLDLHRIEQALMAVGRVHEVLETIPVDLQLHMVARSQGQVVQAVDDADRSGLLAHRLVEDGDAALIQFDRECRPLVAVQRRLGGMAD